MLKSKFGLILKDQWDADTTEKDIVTEMVVDFDDTDTDKPIYIELRDIDTEEGVVIGSFPIALSKNQARQLVLSLINMVNNSDYLVV